MSSLELGTISSLPAAPEHSVSVSEQSPSVLNDDLSAAAGQSFKESIKDGSIKMDSRDSSGPMEGREHTNATANSESTVDIPELPVLDPAFDPHAPTLRRPLLRFNFDAMVDYRRLVTSPWLTPFQLLAFRLFCTILFAAWLMSSLARTILSEQQGEREFGAFSWLFYYTSINLVSVFVFFLTSSIYSLLYVLQLRGLPEEAQRKLDRTAINGPAPIAFQKIPRFINMITWIHAQLQCHLHTVVVIVFWALLYPGSTSSGSNSFWVWVQTGQHTATLFLSLVDFMIGRYGVTGFFQIAFDYGCIVLYVVYAYIQYSLGYGFPYAIMNVYTVKLAWIFYVGVAVMTVAFFFLYVGLQVWRDQRFQFRRK